MVIDIGSSLSDAERAGVFRHGTMSTCEIRVGDLHVNKSNNEQTPRKKTTADGRGTARSGDQPALPSVKGKDQQGARGNYEPEEGVW